MHDQALGQLSGGGSSHYFALPAGSKLFEFEIASVLGHGGFGITYLATDTLLQETVALKEFFPNELAVRVTDATVRAKSDDEQPDFVAGLKAFLEEARLMARFRHRNIVQVRRFFELHGTGYIVQDYEQGQTLSKRLSNGPIGETELRRLLGGVLDGLEAVHERAILHRDLKPDNIILRGDGTPVLIDFGAARDFAGRHSRSITAIAAGGYTPPEQWGVGGQQGPWSDLYALGAIAYRCVTGTAPPISLQRLRSDPLVPATIAAAGKYDPALLSTIDWMLTIDEAKRPASVQAVRDALAGGSAPPRADAPHATGSLTITAAGSGEATLAFEQKISADVLELAFFVEPPGQYLTPSTDDKESWGKEPHYFSLYRSTDAHGQAQFTTEADMAAHIVSGARVTVSSKDGFIRASATWPDIATKLPKRSRARQWLIAAGILIAASIAAGGYQFYRIEQQHREAERQRLIQQLQVAGYDRGAIEQLQGSCGTSCPLDIKAQAQSRLDLIAAEERTYQAAQNDANKLRAYVHDCQACNFKPDAEQQIKRLDEQRQAAERALEKQRQAAEHARLAASLAQAGNDLAALQRFLTECGSTCPPDLRTQAQNLIASEQQHKRAALEDCDRLAASPLDSTRPAEVIGTGFDQIDPVRAVPACRIALAAHPNDVRLEFQLGRALDKGGDKSEAAIFYQKAAQAGSAVAMNNLGALYENGSGVPKDYARARELFEKAATQDLPNSMLALGILYQNGWGVTRDFTQARQWYMKAAAHGDLSAMSNLGALYLNGWGVPKDYAQARQWYEKAAAGGQADAMNGLGALYANGWGVARDYTQARQWYEKAAAHGDLSAMSNLGALYLYGWGVPKDYAQARQWYEKAAVGGQADAMNGLGVLYANGWGVARDYTQARQWYEKAAADGNLIAMSNLGALYLNGWGVPKDYARARQWFEKAAAGDQVNAMTGLGVLYENGWGVPKDYAQARQWYEKAAAGGQADAMNWLGALYALGWGVTRDYTQARQWYEKAAAAGNLNAMINLGGLYQNGRGVKRDHELALQWAAKAAAAGNELAKKNLKLLKRLK